MFKFSVDPCNITALNWKLLSDMGITFCLIVEYVCLIRLRWLDNGAGQLDSAIIPFNLNFLFLPIPCSCAKSSAWCSGINPGNPKREPKSLVDLPLAAHVSGSVGAAQHQNQAMTGCLVSSSASSPEALSLLVLWCLPIWGSTIIPSPSCQGHGWFECWAWGGRVWDSDCLLLSTLKVRKLD